MRSICRRSFIVVLALSSLALGTPFVRALVPGLAQDVWQEQAERLASVLHWQAGSSVAEIGAGDGELTVLAAQRVGPSGKVYSTELDARKLKNLEELAKKNDNIKAIKAGEAGTNLPAGCCDSIFMRLVYHHFTNPAEIDASILRSLKPGGRLAVMERDPPKGSSVPNGVPSNRAGHGITQKLLISELTAAGFVVETVQDDWPGTSEGLKMYCVVFRKK
jgi:ubiquinone/menaquinone biosynthesis C-methylase UbiE